MILRPRVPIARAAALAALALVGARCTGDPDAPSAAAPRSGRQLQISDALHSGGTSGFYWLPPVVPRAAFRGDFLADLDPRVRIDELRADGVVARTLATFTRTSGPGGERVRVHVDHGHHDPDDRDGDDDPAGYYYVRWDTHCAALSPAATYRIRVLVPAAGGGLRELGFADVDVVRDARQVRGVDREAFVPLVAGSTLRIKFRIDRPAVDRDGDGVNDDRDNCPAAPNADQRDTDRDGRGDVCECDGVTCAPVDACHLAGACDGTGSCTRPAAPDGVACPLANAVGACAAGVCRVSACAAGYADCDGDAANGCERSTRTLTDCGACGVRCAAAPHGAPTCATGVCALTCAAGRADCDGDRANGCEQDVAADDAHCGRCNNACADGRSCQAGACTASVCAAGRANCDGAEANGCEVTLADNLAHCGACGNACAAPHGAPACVAGACAVAACDPGWTNCNAIAADGCEVNTAGDAAHCGACGSACVTPNATPVCLGGHCGVGRCDEGWADVNGDPRDGCEVDLRTDPSHCGAIGHVCAVAHGVAGCAAGACVVASCEAGFADCDGAPGNGCEVDTGSDPLRCGACGNACRAGANASPVCVSGRCSLQCAAGFGDCNRFSADGCEVDLATSTRSCGACGNACADGRTCQAGVCTAAACVPGRANCDGAEANGCEVTLATSAAHCGACGNACSFAHATPECNAGACGFSVCEVGYGDCNGAQADGCETPLAGDAAHCGACGNACATGFSCIAGACARQVFQVTNTHSAGPGSLRQAIEDLNASPRGGEIRFNIAPGGAQTIQLQDFYLLPSEPLPEIVKPVLLDGSTQPGATGPAPIRLTNALSAPATFGRVALRVRAPGSVIRSIGFVGGGAYGVSMTECHGGGVEGVVLESPGSAGNAVAIQVERSEGFFVRGCTARRFGVGVMVRDSSDVTIVGNDVRGSGLDAISLDSAIVVTGANSRARIADNLFDAESFGHLRLSQSTPVHIAGAPGPGVDIVLDAARGFGGASLRSLRVYNCPESTISGLDVSWQGAVVPFSAGIVAECARNTLTGIRAERRSHGVRNQLLYTAVDLGCSSFAGSEIALSTANAGTATNNDFSGATTGIEVPVGSPSYVANNNWWGSPSGPSNLGGAGRGFLGNVTVTTWLPARPACAP